MPSTIEQIERSRKEDAERYRTDPEFRRKCHEFNRANAPRHPTIEEICDPMSDYNIQTSGNQ